MPGEQVAPRHDRDGHAPDTSWLSIPVSFPSAACHHTQKPVLGSYETIATTYV